MVATAATKERQAVYKKRAEDAAKKRYEEWKAKYG
tara:strand:+ start:622 stop:726 length:105 start_codon:yes stop_codon:yes gene_type:complete